MKRKLLDQRSVRDKPFRNEIALTAWSGQMIAGVRGGGPGLQGTDVPRRGEQGGRFRAEASKDQGRAGCCEPTVPRRARQPKAAVDGYLEDYAFLVHGLLNLHDATGDKKWLDAGKESDRHDDRVSRRQEARRLLFHRPRSRKALRPRQDRLIDGAQPSGNSVAVRNLVRLWKKTGEERYAQEADKCYRAFAASLEVVSRRGSVCWPIRWICIWNSKEAAQAPR